MSWERFIAPSVSRAMASMPLLTMNKKGEAKFNKAAKLAMFGTSCRGGVYIYLDPDFKRIGFRVAPDADATKISANGNAVKALGQALAAMGVKPEPKGGKSWEVKNIDDGPIKWMIGLKPPEAAK